MSDASVPAAVTPRSDPSRIGPRGAGTPIHRLPRASSTQDEAARRAAGGETLPFAVTTLDQHGGRGRLGRVWTAPAGTGLALTLAVRTVLPPPRRTWIPLLAGVAVLDALEELSPGLRQATGLGLKWPNDVLVPPARPGGRDRKLSGILVEGRGRDTVLIGIGTNLQDPAPAAEDRAAVPAAAWLLGPGGLLAPAGCGPVEPAQASACGARLAQLLVTALLRRLGQLEAAVDPMSAGLHETYRMSCVTLGRDVRIQPLGAAPAEGGADLHGTAIGIDPDGRLVVRSPGGAETAVDAGDVLHAGIGTRHDTDDRTAAGKAITGPTAADVSTAGQTSAGEHR
ncbi:biotin--[acetyl-CoA-carboxylase] ligase [Brachybacterium hainanense]|uniref:biotin--[biotin carboxyl-carrier protein] ligase n=1 Tax=Brachybacterium hainanense TaxID=1541174 RepID=A0ABV6RDJ0_9MICO